MVGFSKSCVILMVGFILSFAIAIFWQSDGGWWIRNRPSILVSFGAFLVRPLIGYDVALAEDVSDFLTFLIPVFFGMALALIGAAIFFRLKLRQFRSQVGRIV